MVLCLSQDVLSDGSSPPTSCERPFFPLGLQVYYSCLPRAEPECLPFSRCEFYKINLIPLLLGVPVRSAAGLPCLRFLLFGFSAAPLPALGPCMT